MKEETRKVKVYDGPFVPRTLTDEDYVQIEEERRRIVEAIDKATRGMERLTPEILYTKLR